jgi:protein-L-isoaspartate O-methyltransferase
MYPLSLELVDFLFSPRAAEVLARLSTEDLGDARTLELVMWLRKQFSPAEAAVLLDQARLRHKAQRKFVHADRLFFTDEALQQATGPACANYRAHAFEGYARVADLGCGIGGDTLALAQVVPWVVAVELDPVRARLAAANVAAVGLADRVEVVCGDWTRMALTVDAAFIDPARRTEQGRRVFSLAEMTPSITAVLELVERVPDVAVKVAPGVDHAEVPVEAGLVFISERGNMKEAVLCFGALRSHASRQAVLLPGPHILEAGADVPAALVRDPDGYLYEPDPAILRASLVTDLATSIGAAQIDPTIAYLTSATAIETPFARRWRILRHGKFNLKGLNRWLRELNVGHVVIKKRGSPIDPDAFQRRLRLARGGEAVTVFFTRTQGMPWMLIATDEEESSEPLQD